MEIRCLSHLPIAVGKNPVHFDLSLARKQSTNGEHSRDWLVLHVQELISLAYQVWILSLLNSCISLIHTHSHTHIKIDSVLIFHLS